MPDIIISNEGSVRKIRINRPEKRNALTLAMYETMAAAIEGAGTEPNVQCLLLAGSDVDQFRDGKPKGIALSPVGILLNQSCVGGNIAYRCHRLRWAGWLFRRETRQGRAKCCNQHGRDTAGEE